MAHAAGQPEPPLKACLAFLSTTKTLRRHKRRLLSGERCRPNPHCTARVSQARTSGEISQCALQ